MPYQVLADNSGAVPVTVTCTRSARARSSGVIFAMLSSDLSGAAPLQSGCPTWPSEYRLVSGSLSCKAEGAGGDEGREIVEVAHSARRCRRRPAARCAVVVNRKHPRWKVRQR